MPSSMYPVQVSNVEIADSCVTMDNGQHNDNGALACERVAMPNALLSSDDKSAAANLDHCLPKRAPVPCIICGHGSDGMIATGGGQLPVIDQLISVMNTSYWEPMLAPFNGRISLLRLFGCQVGANEDGAELLFALADLLNCSVTAPTGIMYCQQGHIWVEGNQWITATPGFHPTPVGPIGHQNARMRLETKLRFRHGAQKREYPIEDVEGISIYRRKLIGQDATITLDKNIAIDLLKLVDFQKPLSINGALSALKTGALQIRVGGAQFSFEILNDRLLQDEDDRRIYYRASSAFERAFRSL